MTPSPPNELMDNRTADRAVKNPFNSFTRLLPDKYFPFFLRDILSITSFSIIGRCVSLSLDYRR